MEDPVHGYIPIDSDILTIIDTPIFQRLSYVKQLTSAYNVFPGARHTRKEHCIGAMHLAREYGKSIFTESKDIKLLSLAALLHDICHGPWSHSWDSTVYPKIYPEIEKGHDIHRFKVVNNILDNDLNKIGVDPEDIINVWKGNDQVMAAIISGPLSIDRMDFVNRDTFYTGTRHFGSFEIHRIINNSFIHNKKLVYDEKIIPDAIQGLNSRLYMYKQVYLHKTVVAASVLVDMMIKESCNELDLVDKTNDLSKFIYLTDEYILNSVLHSTSPKLSTARIYAKSLYERRLPKMISEKIIHINDTNHMPEVEREGDKFIWRSRILSNDFCREFCKYDIHIKTDNKIVPFSVYWNEHYSDWNIQTYYIERVYTL